MSGEIQQKVFSVFDNVFHVYLLEEGIFFLNHNFMHISAVPSSNRNEKCCQMLERLFVAFHHSGQIENIIEE